MSKPRIVYFFMTGCPHCERTWPAWNKAKRSLRRVADIEEKESKEVSPADGVSSFPTFVVRVNGKEVKRVEGAREKSAELVRELGIRRSRNTRRRSRRLTHRTLRNYKALGK